METTPMICPRCKAELDLNSLQIDKDTKYVKCPSCDLYVSISDKNTKTVNINKTIRQETVNHSKLAKLEYKEREDKRAWLFLIIDASVIAFILLIMNVGPIVIQKYNAWQYKRHNEVAVERGLICAGAASEYKEKDWKTVRKQFEDMGFTNISHTRIGGIHPIMGGKVEEISINGRPNFSFNDYFEPDDPVIITHY